MSGKPQSNPKGNPKPLTVVMLGDVVGRAGRRAVQRHMESVRKRLSPDLVVINGENAASGIGITPKVADELFQAGADLITSGNHIWRHKEIIPYLERHDRVLRPRNYPPGTPGRGFTVVQTKRGHRIGVLNLLGRIFMEAVDCPFRCADSLLDHVVLRRDVDALVVDFHAEATSEKCGMGHHLDGRVSAVVGTHTHIPTADHRILSKGTGYMTDLGMTGCYDSIIGMTAKSTLPRMVDKLPSRYQPETREGDLSGVILKINPASGLCVAIQPLRVGPGLEETGLN